VLQLGTWNKGISRIVPKCDDDDAKIHVIQIEIECEF
jgi:hypothetical protein